MRNGLRSSLYQTRVSPLERQYESVGQIRRALIEDLTLEVLEAMRDYDFIALIQYYNISGRDLLSTVYKQTLPSEPPWLLESIVATGVSD